MTNCSTNDDYYEIVVPETWEGLTVADLFKNTFQIPRKLTYEFRSKKLVNINNKTANWQQRLIATDLLQIKLFTATQLPVKPSFYPFEIIYEDYHLIIVNKPAHLKTHPNDASETNTLQNALAYYLQTNNELRRIRHVNRLDQNTSGLIIFSKHEFVGVMLDKLLAEQKIKRTYIAIVGGKFKHQTGVINEKIGRDRHHPTRRRVSRTGQPAMTRYKVIKYLQEEDLSIVKCELVTGRTHQIRVHLSYLGHPLVGDKLYQGRQIAPRQLLHAAKLQLIHPLTKDEIICRAYLQDKFNLIPKNEINHLIDKI